MDWTLIIFWSPVAAVLIAIVVWVSRRNRNGATKPGSFALTTTIWAVTIGLAGLVSGSFIPGLLDAKPGNVQFLVGLFLNGPFGIFLGIVLGALVQRFNVQPVKRLWLLAGITFLYSAIIVSVSVPYYQFAGYLVDGKVLECKEVKPLFDMRWNYWRKEHARLMRGETEVDRVNARLIRERGDDINWEQDIEMITRNRPGVILTVQVFQKGSVYEGFWTTGHVSRRLEWKHDANRTEEFFSDVHGSSCSGYDLDQRAYFQSNTEAWDRYPPRNLPAFLGLQAIKPAADAYKALVRY